MGRTAASPAPAAALAAAVLWVGAAGCAGSRPPLPLRPEPVPLADTLPVPEPAERDPSEVARLVEDALWGELSEPFDLRKWTGTRREALNVTRFDRVVASSWWRPRIGHRPFGPTAVRRGPTEAGPDTSRTLTVVAGKATGVTPGFTVRDARGDRYLLKFDPPGFLHLASAAGVIASRIFWAAGYHVPEDYKIAFEAERLEVAPDATVSTAAGERSMTREDVRGIMARVDTLPDGRHVALASALVPGVPKGPFLFSGVRRDDPNDHYLHQYRRELRGLWVLAAWTNHFDLRFANTLDAYVEPGYLRHYLIDFAGALGSESVGPHRPRDGLEHNFDLWAVVGRLATLGFYRAGWEGEEAEVIHPSVGWMRVESFRPTRWTPNWPNEAYRQMTARDAYWGAKLVGAFSDRHVRAAVEAGRLPDAAAEDTLVDILIHRRDRILEHWYGRVTPLEEPRVEPGAAGRVESAAPDGAGAGAGPPDAASGFTLTFRDLGLEAGAWSPGETRYRWRFAHPARGLEAEGTSGARGGARERVEVRLPRGGGRALEVPGPREALATLRLAALRPGADGRAAVVHLRWRGPGAGYVAAGLEH